MTKKTKLYAVLAAVFAVLVVVGWYLGSPNWTLHQMRAAAVDKDARKLEGYIDFPSVRESLKAQLKAHMIREMEKEKGNPFAGLGMALGMGMADTLIDGMVTPSTMQAVFDSQQTSENGGKLSEIKADDLKMVRRGFSEFELTDPKNPSGANIIFRRDGLGWKLTDIRVPTE